MRTPLLFAVLWMPSAAMAQSLAAGCAAPVIMHSRLADAPYNSNAVYECVLSPDVATSIYAGGSETVGPVTIADPAVHEVRRSVNMVVIQPDVRAINRSPNLSFETNLPDGTKRIYFFLFHVAGYGGVLGIRFSYPEEDAKAKREFMAAQTPAYPTISAQVASTLRTAPFYSPRKDGMNWKYSCMCASWHGGDILYRPDISDNGQKTIVSFKGSVPTDMVVARLDRDGTEKLGELPKRETVVNFTPLSIGGPLVIPDVAEYWSFRSGNEVAASRNDWYHPELVDVRSGSQSPLVVRTVKPTPPPKPQPVVQPQRPVTTAAQ